MKRILAAALLLLSSVLCHAQQGGFLGGGGSITKIASQTVATPGTSVTFTSIPQTYTQLMLVANFTAASTTDNLTAQFNGDTTTAHYAWGLDFQTAGSASGSATTSTNQCIVGGGVGMVNFLLPGYTATSIQGAGVFSEIIVAGQNISGTSSCAWTGSDITSIKLYMLAGGNINSGTFTLYGIS